MKKSQLKKEINEMLNHITVNIGERPTGSKANREVEIYARTHFEKNDYIVESQEFQCIDWINNGAELIFNGEKLTAKPSYYTTGCDLEADFVGLRTVEELEDSDLQNKIGVLAGELTQEQLMPKSFPFYNPESHQKIIRLLEEKRPLAVITAVDNDTSVFEDGDFDIPTAYISKETGQKLLDGQGKISLKIDASRQESKGSNLIARINPDAEKKLVITAHLDTKYGTPGALDNGTGIAILMLFSSLIKPEAIDYCLELLLLNGEDYYSIPGQLKYMEENIVDDESIFLVINCDGVGLKDSKTAISFMELDEFKQELIAPFLTDQSEIELIEPWEMGDHMLFVMHGIPAITFTSKKILNLIDEIAHTEKDAIDIIDYRRVLEVIELITELAVDIGEELS